jgi:3-deoxy-D-manno-octulosonic-acid transferase
MRHNCKYHRLPLTTVIIYWLYQLTFPIFIISALSLAAWRSLKEPSHLTRLADRFGFGPVGPKGAIWVYAASLGEMNAARPLVQVFLDNGHDILLTHLSPAGLKAGQKFFGEHPKVTHRYIPLDFFLMVKLFLRRAKPACGIVLEIEIWPAMLIQANRLGVPMYLVNGNLLAKSMTRLNTWKRSGLHMYRLFDHIFTRADDYVDRYKATGVLHKDLTVTGELRLDIPRNPISIAKGQAWREAWAGKEFTFMIASSVKVEENVLIQCCIELSKQVPTIKIIWVPRSPQRFAAISQKAQKAGLLSMRRSDCNNSIPNPIQVFVGDSMGEMDIYLGMADVVFVGASFSNGGGHNIVEPLSTGCPVVMGPSTYGVDFIAKDATSAGIFHSFSTPEEMTNFIIDNARSPQKLEQMRSNSSTFCKMNIGASERCYDMIKFHI